jgi:fructose-1,6-bisphosphatase/sedoheptulose 1,7-bisphosphatase-like protein
MERNLAMDLVRVTEAAALASARHMGRGDDVSADTAAVEAMRTAFDAIAIDGSVVIGEGPEDAIPMLYVGERVGTGQGPQVDVALDAIEGATSCATGAYNAISVIAIADPGSLLRVPDTYMEKIACGPEGRGVVDLDRAPQGIISAAALRCLGGEMQARLRPRNEFEAGQCRALGLFDLQRKYTIEQLASGLVMCAATGVTPGDYLAGVRYVRGGAVTNSVVMRAATRTVRFIQAHHHFDRKPEY